MILESKHDPYDSIFNFIKKIQKSGRYHPMLKQFLRALLLQKLQSEITFDEFKHNLLIIICKLVSYIIALSLTERSELEEAELQKKNISLLQPDHPEAAPECPVLD